MNLPEIVRTAVSPALALLPRNLDTPAARVMLLAIGQQESGFTAREQMGGGPARGFWQFEKGTQISRGGVWGVYLHRASGELLRLLCRDRDCTFDPTSIWGSLAHDDVLAAGVARLMLLTDAAALPAVDDTAGGWDCYARTWRPGKPRRETWDAYHLAAVAQVTGGAR